ncbi:uncharacterized protein Z519_05053 [Cladophialophora bantiana CBS 173.52]|uniref:Ribonuclease H2 subunit B n=1 Tax=Cladophialophora bantiana (strain ATCC 10958 / CBS 173.52 / CDC B-1940 / NIH 8579) TaxID=1442370 RepID=A0A0D2HKC9_CLAB1|nr:uncharacterized protein Z519_05053 [Cladophialophora bantiana CBS 173.52]KIW93738.1 hypothetical protein Z519_05053 [Cladophialophora bantiana CBS 173.52]
MPVATRAGSASPVKKPFEDTAAVTTNLQREPLKHFILPRDISDQARFLLLRHPRDGSAQRFLFCPDKGLFHFSRISAPTMDPRSLLFTACHPERLQTHLRRLQDECQRGLLLSKGYISKSADFYTAAPFDLVFILVPLVLPGTADGGKALFQPIDDLLEQQTQDDKELRYLMAHGRTMVENAMLMLCDTIEVGGQQMYRPSEEKTLRVIIQKVNNAVDRGLPASLQEKFVTRALEAPILSLKREEILGSTQTGPLPGDEDDFALDSLDSQSSATSTAQSAIFSEVSTTSSIRSVDPEPVSKELFELQKRRVVLDFILASYLPGPIAERLRARFAAQDSVINFAPLEDHLRSLDTLKAEALASRSMMDFSRKRGLEDDEAAESRSEKKRKQEEEERKKKLGESRGVRELKKVNVSGMKKMNDFFPKKPTATVP